MVDDQPVNVKLLEKKLVREEMDVWTANDGETCLNIVNEHKPAVILLDVMMPNMDGHEVCARLQEQEETRSIPVIFITASKDPTLKKRAKEAGAVCLLEKPFDATTLADAIEMASTPSDEWCVMPTEF